MIGLADVEDARTTIGDALRVTPTFSATSLGDRLGVDLRVKAELLQRTGSFKPRGALNRLRKTPREDLDRGLITVSAGNHAAGLAFAARIVGARCTLVMPEKTAAAKVEAARAYGGDVVLHGDIPGAYAQMEVLREERGLVLVHPYDDELVMAGAGTVGLEIVEQVLDVDVVVVPVGGGGLVSGVATAVKGLRPEARVYGVEPTGAAGLRASLDADEAVVLSGVDTVVDSLAAPKCGAVPWETIRGVVDDSVTLSDAEIVDGMRAVWQFTKLYAEPAGAAPVAALLAGKIPVDRDDTVVALVSGGNLDPTRVPELLQRV